MVRTARIIAGVSLLLLGACARSETAGEAGRSGEAGPAGTVPAPPAEAAPPTVVFLGTSLTAGLGLDPDDAFPAVVQRKIDSAGLKYTVVNAGVSGESSAGAVRRIDWILRQPPAVLIVETGANDGLRGQDPDSLAANIQRLIDQVRRQSPATTIILAGMEALPNLGAEYTSRFRKIYPALSRSNHTPLIPFLLDGVAGVDSLNQQDGIHPTEAGARIVADNVWRVLRGALK
jgi:acyl-CoA thioesterase I